MANDILYPISEACENLYASLISVEEKSTRDEIILEHIKSCANMKIRIGDFKNNLEWFNVSQPLSLKRDLQGKVVVLDFFTYCCINCLHILPTLRQLEAEFSVEDGLVVVGVHSAKFDNEKDSANILAAIQRYNITHPVVNDADGTMWHELAIPCWPTLLILGPEGDALFLVIGESQKSEVMTYVRCALKHYRDRDLLKLDSLPLSVSHHVTAGPLLFPSKVACTLLCSDVISVNNNSIPQQEERLAISDTGYHRVILFNTSGRIEHVVGGDEPGFSDGCFREARFSSPQGVVFHSANLLYVADAENHAIREINLKTLRVSTLFEQEGCSPWDLCLVPPGDVMLIAMAGVHQIWAYFFTSTTWWKGKVYDAGTCVSIAGTGREENRNNLYPHAAGFAQPSGLTVSPEQQAVFIADSESSTVRKMSLVDGKVSAVVGGDRSPFNLFVFGDKDGKQFEVKLQHPLGVAWCSEDQKLYVADSYNHKVKVVDTQQNLCTSLVGTGTAGDNQGQFSEPGGLCLSSCGAKLYVADTNNHCIKVVHLQTCSTSKLPLFLPSDHREPLTSKSFTGTVLPTEVKVNSEGGEIDLSISLSLSDGVELTEIAPQKWALDFPDASWSASSGGGEYAPEMTLRVIVPKRQKAMHAIFSVNYRLYVCVEHSECSVQNVRFLVTVLYDDNTDTRVQHQVSHVISL